MSALALNPILQRSTKDCAGVFYQLVENLGHEKSAYDIERKLAREVRRRFISARAAATQRNLLQIYYTLGTCRHC